MCKDTTAVAPKLTTSEVTKNPLFFWESHDPTQYSINKAKLKIGYFIDNF